MAGEGVVGLLREIFNFDPPDPNRVYPNEPLPRGEEALKEIGFGKYATGGKVLLPRDTFVTNRRAPELKPSYNDPTVDVEGVKQEEEWTSNIQDAERAIAQPWLQSQVDFKEDPFIGFTLGNAAIAIKRSPIAQFGFDPDKTVFGRNLTGTAVGTTSQLKDEAGMFVALSTDDPNSGATIVHEAIHNGLKKLREAGASTYSGSSDVDEEILVRALIYKYYGDIEEKNLKYAARQLGIPDDELEKTEGWKQIHAGKKSLDNPSVRGHIYNLEAKAKEMLKNKKGSTQTPIQGSITEVIKEVFSGPEEEKLKNVKPPKDQSDFMDVFRSVFSQETAKTLVEDVIPGTSDVVSAKRSVDSLGEAGAAIRKGDVTGALKGYADAATNAVGALPMVPAIGGILTGARGAAKGIAEIEDKTSYLSRTVEKALRDKGVPVLLSKLYPNKALFDLYPELDDVIVRFDPNIRYSGNYDPKVKVITLSGEDQFKTLIHELQHAVDDIETKGKFIENYVSPEVNLEKYLNDKFEVRARQAENRIINNTLTGYVDEELSTISRSIAEKFKTIFSSSKDMHDYFDKLDESIPIRELLIRGRLVSKESFEYMYKLRMWADVNNHKELSKELSKWINKYDIKPDKKINY